MINMSKTEVFMPYRIKPGLQKQVYGLMISLLNLGNIEGQRKNKICRKRGDEEGSLSGKNII
jgi:hypothetical protein